jgi:dihydrofolate synthase
MSIDLSLVRIRRLFSLLPTYKRPTIHVAGTNGKGSVTAILSSIFSASHLSVGRFNSPHLVHVWDAISINGLTISSDVYRSARSEVESLDKSESVGASSFEIMTATAAQIFEQARVDIAIFEAGLGGRLDATNVLSDDVILASAITNIDLDHQKFLGNTPSAIAREKAAIARKAKPCILGAQRYPEAQHAVQEVVHGLGGRLVTAFEVTPRLRGASHYTLPEGCQSVTAPFQPWETTLDLELPLRGAHQLENLATALTILSVIIKERSGTPLEAALNGISPSTLFIGVFNTKWPGRLEHIELLDPPLTLLADGAHNAASARALQTYLLSIGGNHMTSSRPPRTFILGLSDSPPKTPSDTLTPLLYPGDCVAFVPFADVDDMPWVKNVPLHELEHVAQELVKDGSVRLFERQPNDAPLNPLKRALAWANGLKNGEEIVLAGSLYLVADLYRLVEEQTL